MKPFLKSIAEAYSGRYADMTDVLFLFPNKRSCVFFTKYLTEELSGRPFISPMIETISTFVESLCGMAVDNRIDLIFLLYKTYCDIIESNPQFDKNGEFLDFDNFRKWGETVLNDFGEVDQYLVDPDEIFKNVKDLKHISSNFLDDNQIRVIREYFGRDADGGEGSTFWKNFNKSYDSDGDEDSVLKKKFRKLWEVMGPLYHLFNERLKEKSITTSGRSYRLALERLCESGDKGLWFNKIVIIGFNALSASELAIFDELASLPCKVKGHEDEPLADFIWDGTGPILASPDNSDNAGNSASRILNTNRKHFPEPVWLSDSGIMEESSTDSLPESLKLISAPSNSAQTKIISEEIKNLHSRLKKEKETEGNKSQDNELGEFGDEESRDSNVSAFKDAKVAVVLPDEGLLLPMLHSIPEGIGDVNITMGYPLRLTSAISFVNLFRKLQFTRKFTANDILYYTPDLRLILSHPYSFAMSASDEIDRLIAYIDKYKLINIPFGELKEIAPELSKILLPLSKNSKAAETIATIDKVMSQIEEKISESPKGFVKASIDGEHIKTYREALRRLAQAIIESEVDMKYATVFHLADKMLAGEQVNFIGEPLSGLQIMGLLETRAIDFDYIIIGSFNDKVLPMKMRSRTFISDSLRAAYDMPPARYQENLFAYYFYRMISRAKEVVMVYDGRDSSGMRAGGLSRYGFQLDLLYAPGKVKKEIYTLLPYDNHEQMPDIDKTDEIYSSLSRFLSGYKEPESNTDPNKKPKNLSATALQRYASCPMKFFYINICGLPDSNESTLYIDEISLGNIFHEFMEWFYLPDKEQQGKFFENPILITPDYISRKLEDEDALRRQMIRITNAKHLNLPEDKLDTPLSAANAMVIEGLLHQAKNVLRHDMALGEFKLYGCEISQNIHYRIGNSPEFNFRYAIDRLDAIEENGEWVVRVVDYKTGTPHCTYSNMNDIFSGAYNARNLLQIFLYCKIVKDMYLPDAKSIRPVFYDVAGITKNALDNSSGHVYQETGKKTYSKKRSDSGTLISDYSMVAADYEQPLCDMINELFDKGIPFRHAPEENCKFCNFKATCHR